MEKIFVDTENTRTNEPYIFKLDVTDKLNRKKSKQKHGFLQKHQVRIQKQ